MKLEAQVLTAKAIEAFEPDRVGAYRVRDLRCKGLALRVAPMAARRGILASASNTPASGGSLWAATRTSD